MAVNGHVDDELRALVRVSVAPSQIEPRQEIVAWVDTAFNGGLTIPRSLIGSLRLPQESSVDAVLADGRTVALETFGCCLDWFGATYHTQVVASDGKFPLLGTQLLAGRRLAIDYAAGTVELK
jgi:clan AA aspartic protease